DVRMMFFAENAFPMDEFVRLQLGPVVMKDEIEYAREINLLDEVRVTLVIAGLAEDGSRWLMRNEFYRPDSKLAATVTSSGGWLGGPFGAQTSRSAAGPTSGTAEARADR